MCTPRAKKLRMTFSDAASGLERDLIWIDAQRLPSALFAVSAQIMRRILLDSARKRAASTSDRRGQTDFKRTSGRCGRPDKF